MPGFVLHLLHGKFILENMPQNFNDEQTAQFMQGILMPDSNEGYEKDISHFISPLSDSRRHILQIPDLGIFVSKYRQYLSEPFVLGYLAHLYLDRVFFKYFFLRYISFLDENNNKTLDKKYIQKVYLLHRNEYISVDQLFSEEYLYGDYTAFNAILINRYSLEIPRKTATQNPIEEVNIEKFSSILSDLEHYLATPLSQNPELKIFEQAELESFIQDQANDFVQYCQEIGLKESNVNIKINTDESKNINVNIMKTESQQVNIDDDDAVSSEDEKDAKDKWDEGMKWEDQDQDVDFDFKSEQYYRISWEQLCKQAHTHKAEDLLFMDRLILRARYVYKNKELQKNKYFKGEKSLKRIALWTAILNAVRFYHFNDLIEKWDVWGIINMVIDNVLNVLCVVVSAIAAWKTSMILINSSKETWLRHMSFYSKITLEADRLFAGSGDYQKLSSKEKIALFKAKTVTYTEDDYENFFANMSGNKNSTGENSSSSTNVSSSSSNQEQNT